jgi:hypothetical protein
MSALAEPTSQVPMTGADAAALAMSFVTNVSAGTGMTKSQCDAYINTGPWATYGNNPWCAWFASWVARGASDIDFESWAGNLYGMATPTSTPAPGDFVYYPGDGHIGVVVEVTSAGTARVVEGNAGDAPGIIKYRVGGPYTTNHLFARPTYTGTTGGSTDMGVLLRSSSDDKYYLLEELRFTDLGITSSSSSTVAAYRGAWGPTVYVSNATLAVVDSNRSTLIAEIAAAVAANP